MMSRRQFTALAEVVHGLREEYPDVPQTFWASLSARLGCVCVAENPRFEMAKFLEACGSVGEEAILASGEFRVHGRMAEPETTE